MPDRLVSETPSNVQPFCSIIGIAASRIFRDAVIRTSVRSVDSYRVCDLVARVKSSNRSRRTTVRVRRSALRSRLPSRSMIATSVASSSPGDFRATAHRAL